MLPTLDDILCSVSFCCSQSRFLCRTCSISPFTCFFCIKNVFFRHVLHTAFHAPHQTLVHHGVSSQYMYTYTKKQVSTFSLCLVCQLFKPCILVHFLFCIFMCMKIVDQKHTWFLTLQAEVIFSSRLKLDFLFFCSLLVCDHRVSSSYFESSRVHTLSLTHLSKYSENTQHYLHYMTVLRSANIYWPSFC